MKSINSTHNPALALEVHHLIKSYGKVQALRGVLNKLWDLNLTLLSVKCKRHSSRR